MSHLGRSRRSCRPRGTCRMSRMPDHRAPRGRRNLGKVTIGEKATVSHRVHVCAGTHDYTDPALPLLRPEIRIGNQTWICANTFIGPDIEIGEGAVIGAGTVMVKDAESWGVYAGNPAKYIKKRILKH